MTTIDGNEFIKLCVEYLNAIEEQKKISTLLDDAFSIYFPTGYHQLIFIHYKDSLHDLYSETATYHISLAVPGI